METLFSILTIPPKQLNNIKTTLLGSDTFWRDHKIILPVLENLLLWCNQIPLVLSNHREQNWCIMDLVWVIRNAQERVAREPKSKATLGTYIQTGQ